MHSQFKALLRALNAALVPSVRAVGPVAIAATLACVAGPLRAQVVVSDGGQPSYRFPIKVPPAIGGFGPEISLVYDGSSMGVLGKGWRIDGVPSIGRCQPTRSIDGADGVVNWSDNDKLCLNGERLIKTDAAGSPLPFPQSGDAGAGGEYRLERDRLVRVRSYGQIVQSDPYVTYGGAAQFKVWTRDGRIQTHKAALDQWNSILGPNVSTPMGGKAFVGWPFVTESDKAGNAINYVSGFGWGQFVAPIRIGYNGTLYPGSYGVYPVDNTSIVFNYEALPSNLVRRVHYRGSLNTLSSRLASIDIVAGLGSVSRRIFLAYSESPATGVSQLVSIKECVGTTFTQCQPPTTFSYTNGGVAFTETTSYIGGGSIDNSSGVPVVRSITGDFNGDGRTDVLVTNSAGPPTLYLSAAGGGHIQSTVTNGASIQVSQSLLVADFDGDGLDDVFVSQARGLGEECGTLAYSPSGATCSLIFKSIGDGTFTKQVVRFGTGSDIPLKRSAGTVTLGTVYQQFEGAPRRVTTATINDYHNFVIGDFNADGRLDIVKISATGQYWEGSGQTLPGIICPTYSAACEFQLLLGNGDGTFVPATSSIAQIPYIVPSAGNLRAFDVNADGVPDLVFGGKSVAVSSGGPASVKEGYYAGRTDGSFVVDVVSFDPNTGQSTLGGLRPDCTGGEFVGDFNGDGLPDSICVTNTMTLFTWTGVGYLSQQLQGSQPWYIVGAADVDGDGRPELLGGYQGGIISIDGQAGLTVFNMASLGEYSSFLSGNFTGSGGTEFLMLGNYANRLLVKSDPLPPHLLLSVTEPSGAVTTLTYESLTATTRYASDRGTSYASVYPIQEPSAAGANAARRADLATYRLVDNIPRSFVVTRVTTDSGVGTAQTTTELAYRGFKTDLLGRGTLGFREVRRQSDSPDGTSKLTSVQLRLQAYPYTGAVAVSETYLGALSPIGEPQGGIRLSRTENIYCDLRAAAGAEASATVSAPCPVTSKVQRPYVRKTVQSTWDLNGAAMPVTTTTTTYSGGYPTLVETQTVGPSPAGVQTFVSSTVNEYFTDSIGGDNWLLGLLKKSTVTKTAPNALGAISTSAGSAPKATATAGP